MKHRMTLALCALGLLMFTGAVLADHEPNDSVDTAEKMNFISDVSGSVGGEDNADFYKLEVTPKTILKLSVEYMPPTEGPFTPYLSVEARIRNREKVEFKLDISGTETQIKKVEFKNKEKDSVELYIRVSGYGEYVLDPEISTSVDTICCGSALVLGIAGLSGTAAAALLIKRRSS